MGFDWFIVGLALLMLVLIGAIVYIMVNVFGRR
jgi:hypothetical protein